MSAQRKVMWCLLAAALALSACGKSGSGAVTDAQPAASGNVPVSPPPGESRDGGSYSILITAPDTGDTVAFTVFEPTTLEGGQKYPLVLYGHGGGEQRVTDTNNPATANQPINNPKQFIQNGYGVISMDQRGHGESSGTIRIMDPDFEGRDLLALLDWAEANLDWLAYGPSVDGRDPHNLILGAIGASYGGAFQMLIHNIDPKHRLDAIIPEATWYDTNFSLAPGGVIKTIWPLFLALRLSAPGNQPDPSRLDPYLQNLLFSGLTTGKINAEQHDFLYYHSNAYFCNGAPVMTNGGPGTVPLFASTHPGKIHALFMQGMRDTLFNLNESYSNYMCLREAGGDVRLRSYQFGHNATPVVPDPGLRPVAPNPNPAEFTPPLEAYDNHCGSLDGHTAGLAFFDEHLKGIKDAADIIPSQICLSLSAADGVLVDKITVGHAGTQADIPPTTVIAGISDLPVVVALGITAGTAGDVLAGIPRLEVDVGALSAGFPGEPILFAGIGIKRAPLPGLPLPLIWDLADNQIMPLRGLGRHEIDLIGIGERLQPGDQLALLLYGGHNQYAVTGSVNLGQPTAMPVTVSGKIWLPLLGSLPPAP